MIIPVKPLQAKTTYHATITLRNSVDTVTRTWSFTTGAAGSTSGDEAAPAPKPKSSGRLTSLRLDRPSGSAPELGRSRLRFSLSKPVPNLEFELSYRTQGFWLVGGGAQSTSAERTTGTHRLTLGGLLHRMDQRGSLAPGRYRLTMRIYGANTRTITFQVTR